MLVFRATDRRHTDAMIAAVKRGVPVRLIHDPQQYRDTASIGRMRTTSTSCT